MRRTVAIDPREPQELREWYGAKTDAEAIRSAIYSVLQLAALQDIHDHLADYGTDDGYDPNGGQSKLPVLLKPGDIPPEEVEDFLAELGSSLDDDAHGAR